MSGFLNFFGKIFGNKYEKDVKEITPIVNEINLIYNELNNISNDELREISNELRGIIQDKIKEEKNTIKKLKEKSKEKNLETKEKENIYLEIDSLEKIILEKIKETLSVILPKAFAVIKETAKRFTENDTVEVTANDFDKDLASDHDFVNIKGEKAIFNTSWDAAGTKVKWEMIHYDVQLIGGIVLHQGKIAEMQTGEGKTLSATLPIYLNALTGLGVHLVTVNDYLAKRDAEWMGPIFQFHGMSVDCIDNHEPNSDSRRDAYLADITYGTNNEFGFDYLRDNMSKRREDLVQRKLHYAIIDEVDSVLIDDARTPLIISGPTPKGDQHEYNIYKSKIEQVVSVQRKFITTVIAEAKQLISNGDKENGGLNLLRAYRGLPRNKALIKYLSEDGVKHYYKKQKIFICKNKVKKCIKLMQNFILL